MRCRHPNPRRVKIHRSYTIQEAAEALGVHVNTIRNYVRRGLQLVDDDRPLLILGSALRQYLVDGRRAARQRCGPGDIFCIRCRSPKKPAARMADYIPITEGSGNLRGICPDCNLLIHRRVSWAALEAVRGDLDVTFPEGLPRIGESSAPSLECNLKGQPS